MIRRTGNNQLLKDLNQHIVLNLIVRQKAISRSDLARLSGLPGGTITRITADLLAARLLQEEMVEEGTRGRPRTLLSLNPSAGFVMGVKLSEYGIYTVLCDLHCTILHSDYVAFAAEPTPEYVVETITVTIEKCLQEKQIPLNQVLGVGIAMAGILDAKQGISIYSPMLCWENVALGPALRERLHVPIRLDNDVNALAVAERQFGAGQDFPNFLLVIAGVGIGLGIIQNGEIYRGALGRAGEFGHINVDTSAYAPLCHCGKHGCLEAFVSSMGLVHTAGLDSLSGSLEEKANLLFQKAESGDSQAYRILQRAGEILGIALANLINILDPNHLLLGIGSNIMREAVETMITRYTFGPTFPLSAITYLENNEFSWARGAASLILHEIFQFPLSPQDSFVNGQASPLLIARG